MPFKKSAAIEWESRLTAVEWESLSYEEFLKLYEDKQFLVLRRYLERRIKSDFIRILASTGLVGDVFFTARIKKPYAAFDKLPRMIAAAKEKNPDFKRYVVYELIRDLVAIRLICVDS